MQFFDDQAASRIELDGGAALTKCDQCRQQYSERVPPDEPPCNDCWVDLMEENNDAAKIFRIVRGQVISLHNGQHDEVIDLNFCALKVVMDWYEIQNQRECFEKVHGTFHHFIRERHQHAG